MPSVLIIDQVNLVRLFIYRMVKRLRRVLGGTSQIQRICSGATGDDAGPHTAEMTSHFWKEWSSSKKLRSLFHDCAGSPDMNVTTTMQRIVELKKVSDHGRVRENLRLCLTDIRGVNVAVAEIKNMQAEKFSSDDQEHEAKLNELWELLLPGQERAGGRISREWGRIGFQQSDPATDFRGGGILSLNQLLHIARNRQPIAQRMIREPALETARYPWACVGINLTDKAVGILNSHAIDASLYGKSVDQVMEIFNSLYADMFEILHGMWITEKPENILAFPPVLESAMKSIREEIAATGMLVPPGA